MSAKRTGLGRGFDSLIPTELFDESFDPTSSQDEHVSDLRHVALSEVSPDPDQPRRHFDEASLVELATSIKQHGVLQPIVVVPKGSGYVIVAGERRYRAALEAGLQKIPALVRTLSNQHKLEVSLIENLQRRDLNVIETATAYLKLRDQFSLTLDEIGQRVGGKSVSAISNTLRLLRLPPEVKRALADGIVSEGQVRPLINVDAATTAKVFPLIVKENWSARKIEHYIAALRNDELPSLPKASPASVAAYQRAQQQWHQRLKTPVNVRTNARGAGTIAIKFKDEADLRRITDLLGR